MNLLFLIDDITRTGGTERITLTLASNFFKEGINCEIFSLKKENSDTFYPSLGINIIYSSHKNRFMALIEAVRYAKKTASKLIVVSMGRLSFEMTILSRIFLFKDIYLYEHISFESFPGYIQLLKISAYKIARGVAFLTEHDVKIVNARITHPNLCAIDNVNSFVERNYIPTEKRKNIVLAVGRFTYQKNFLRLIQLWGKLDSLGWSLVIIGSGPEKELLETEIKKASYTNVFLKDPTQSIDDIYKDAKIYAMTSRYEGLPMVLIEAQGFGVPAISFNCKTGPAEIILNDITGFVVDYDNDVLFVTRLQELMNDKNKLDRMSINAYELAKRFTFDEVKHKWFGYLQEK
jgi:amylovoran biosynthesis glycosyltransferase AmsD